MTIKKYYYDVDEAILNNLIKNNITSIKKDLQHLFICGVYYALTYFNKIRFHQYVDAFNEIEIGSYVYFAFKYAVDHFKWKKMGMDLNKFKNYFFQIIRFHTLDECKLHGYWTYKKIKSWKQYDQQTNDPKINQKEIQQWLLIRKIKIVRNFISQHKKIYVTIFDAKLQGKTLIQVAKEHNIALNVIKSHYQYMKKLIVIKYKNIDNINID